MSLLVYPKTDAQMNILTSLFKEMNIKYEFNTDSEIPNELALELEKRLENLKKHPEQGISFEQVKQKLRQSLKK